MKHRYNAKVKREGEMQTTNGGISTMPSRPRTGCRAAHSNRTVPGTGNWKPGQSSGCGSFWPGQLYFITWLQGSCENEAEINRLKC